MSQLGEGTSPERTYSMDWSQEHPSQQETRCIYDCGTYNYNREQWREPFVSQMEKSTNTDGFCDALTADCGGSEESESEIETEEHKECIQPCYIKDEVASPASFVSPGCEAKYDFENNHLPQPTTCPCAIKRICPYEVCNELGICSTWAETRMQIDADIQADSFECGFPIKCIKCGKTIQDRSSCQQRYLIPIYECNSCIAHGTTGPGLNSYLESIEHNTAADPRIVPCEYCKKKFETVRGMRIHVGHVHKGARAKN
ncbi:uncharacterized protein LOC126291833 isoform X2 [Schistocerca gregaria]|uniref:uncharacterized protein LOC126291833 isoform X2 n=1 Tax=Schistocerca gregaria TaxID=7010 RepID=UPI00211EFF0D|nr:uncharacterized protein LOC126291833 isoform X2 [Schistocerca gregaria]